MKILKTLLNFVKLRNLTFRKKLDKSKNVRLNFRDDWNDLW